jgi:hypothetical protein
VGVIAQRRERATNVGRRRGPDSCAKLSDLDGDGLPCPEGEDDAARRTAQSRSRDGVVAEMGNEAGRNIAGLVAEAEREEE